MIKFRFIFFIVCKFMYEIEIRVPHQALQVEVEVVNHSQKPGPQASSKPSVPLQSPTRPRQPPPAAQMEEKRQAFWIYKNGKRQNATPPPIEGNIRIRVLGLTELSSGAKKAIWWGKEVEGCDEGRVGGRVGGKEAMFSRVEDWGWGEKVMEVGSGRIVE